MTTKTAAKKLLADSLLKVESKSIREWAVTPQNKPIWLQIAENAVKNTNPDPANFAAYIVCVAIGA
jgi:hypothetical protein